MKQEQLHELYNKGEIKKFKETVRKNYYVNQGDFYTGKVLIYTLSKGTGNVTIRKGNLNKRNGYDKITFTDETLYIHKIVADAWVYNPNPEVFTEVDHIDPSLGKRFNHYTNLRHVTRKQNMQFANDNGLLRNANKRAAEANRKLTYEQAQNIRIKYSTGEYTQKQLAEEYDVSTKCISAIVLNKTYKVAY